LLYTVARVRKPYKLLKRNFASGRLGEGNELIRNGLRLGYEWRQCFKRT